jgi:hypothetical protein
MRRLTTGIRSQKCVVRRFRPSANVIMYLCKPWNLALTRPPYGWKSFQTAVSRIRRYHPFWKFALASNFPPQSAYLDFPKFLTTVVYAVCRWPKRRYAESDCTCWKWTQQEQSVVWLAKTAFPQTFLLADPLLASKDNHGSSHPSSSNYSVTGWKVGFYYQLDAQFLYSVIYVLR